MNLNRYDWWFIVTVCLAMAFAVYLLHQDITMVGAVGAVGYIIGQMKGRAYERMQREREVAR